MELLSVTMNDGVMPRSEIEGKDNSSDDKSNYKVVRSGDMVYNSMRMWQGANGISPYDGIVSPAYTVLMPRVPISNGYFAALFKSPNLINEFRKNSQGMTSDTWNLKYPQIETIKICVPMLAEQEHISDMLRTLEVRIAKQSKLVEALKKYKRGLSSTLFHDISRRSDCRKMSFSEVFTIVQNNTFSRDDLSSTDGSVLNIHYGDVLIKYGAVVDVSSAAIPFIKPDRSVRKYNESSYLQNGDIVFADTAEDYTVGKATEVTGITDERILSGLHTIPCRPNEHFAKMYLGYYFNSDDFRSQIFKMVQGVKVSSISKSEIVKTYILVPSIQEQTRIATILSKIDSLIKHEEMVITALVRVKRGLLQQMFI